MPIDSWFDDENDTELSDLIPFLEGIHAIFILVYKSLIRLDMTKVDNVMTVLDTSHRS